MKPLRVLYVVRAGRLARLAQPAGSYPDELFYGYVQLARRPGFEADLIERASPSAVGRLAQRFVEFWTNLAPEYSNRGVLNRSLLERYDAVVSVHEPVLLALARRKASRADGAALVLIFIGAEKRLERSRLRPVTRWLLHRLFERCAAVVVLGEGERDYLLAERLVRPERLHFVPFGVDERFWTPAPAQEATAEWMLAVGNDDGRDYATLLRAAGGRALRLHTSLPIEGRLLGPTVVRSGGDWQGQTLSDLELRELYRGARFVVTPLRESAQPSGQSVTLQAMACGKPVILSRTRGLWSPSAMRHMENCVLVPPGDVAGLRDAIERMAADATLRERIGREARRSVERHFTSGAMAERIGALLESVARP